MGESSSVSSDDDVLSESVDLEDGDLARGVGSVGTGESGELELRRDCWGDGGVEDSDGVFVGVEDGGAGAGLLWERRRRSASVATWGKKTPRCLRQKKVEGAVEGVNTTGAKGECKAHKDRRGTGRDILPGKGGKQDRQGKPKGKGRKDAPTHASGREPIRDSWNACPGVPHRRCPIECLPKPRSMGWLMGGKREAVRCSTISMIGAETDSEMLYSRRDRSVGILHPSPL